MPPKNSSSATNTTKAKGPTKEQLKAIKDYLAAKPDFDQLIAQARASPQSPVQPVQSEYEKTLRSAVKATLEERRAEAEAKGWKRDNMPVHPKEEEANDHIYDQVAKESKDSNASDHELHQTRSQQHAQAHAANPGPVMAENLGEPASREELEKRAAELNQKK